MEYNIVHIYAEGLERTYFDQKLFPGLMRHLSKLQRQSIDFSHIYQVQGTEVTIAGLVGTQCGIPLTIPIDMIRWETFNSMSGVDYFYKGAYCIGDFLSEMGYTLHFLQGASTIFGGKGAFFHTHGFQRVEGREELVHRLEDESYMSGWGLYDDSLFEIAYERFEELSASGRKFGLYLLTLDTHHPRGHPSASCQSQTYLDGSNPMLNAVACSDYLIARFINRIIESEYGDNTIVVVSSDHLAMNNTASDILNSGYRTNLFFMIHPEKENHELVDKQGSVLDMASIVLSKLGYDVDIGLGRNLLAPSRQSLLTLSGDINRKLREWNSILRLFWEFPKLAKIGFVNLKDESVRMGRNSYRIPVLVSVDEDMNIVPIFDYNVPKKLPDHLIEFDPTKKFVWIDHCERINAALGASYKEDFCLAQGILGGEIELRPVKRSVRFSTGILRTDLESNEEIYANRLNRLAEMSSG